eukprot:CAMPEP_0172660022 /NCGR_PEP_ID=MMETSP1074-20121228/3846_1 /TAXON_ID=2916 /ORGANISM="Ceratium fusus, Strain PA161109" /LENGTH=255 /DNA_ID=CAMNT_0013475621 /DNA_START=72 /DNA_END=839 /DNA_ORIENTATION=-
MVASDEPEVKKAKTDGDSYYKVIDGVKYDRGLLDMVERFAADGQVGYPEAKKLWADAQDGNKLTDIERATLKYAMETYKFTDKAANFLKVYLEAGTHSSYYKLIDGKKYDRELLEAAEKYAADGQISKAEAKALLEDAADGKGITGTEKDTLEYALEKLKFTPKAKEYMEGQLKSAEPKSYYKIIDGVKYDASLLLEVESLAKDGLISEAEAHRLWSDAEDGKGITDIEKATFKHALATIKFTDPAKTFLEGKLA